MVDTMTQWEYQVISVGSFWSVPKDEEIQAALDELGEEGWELVSAFSQYGHNQVRMVLKRPLGAGTRRQRSWPGQA